MGDGMATGVSIGYIKYGVLRTLVFPMVLTFFEIATFLFLESADLLSTISAFDLIYFLDISSFSAGLL